MFSGSLKWANSYEWLCDSPSVRLAYSAQNPFYSPVEYSPTQKMDIDRAAAAARRVLMPHALLLQMLLSRFQAVRYSQPGLVLLILRLVLRSARAHSYLRCVFCHASVIAELMKYIVPTLLQEKIASRFWYLASRPSRVLRWILPASTIYAKRYIRLPSLGSPPLLSAYRACIRITRGVDNFPRWSFGADRVQLEGEVKVLNEFLLLVQGDSVKNAYHISALDSPRYGAGEPKTFHVVLRSWSAICQREWFTSKTKTNFFAFSLKAKSLGSVYGGAQLTTPDEVVIMWTSQREVSQT